MGATTPFGWLDETITAPEPGERLLVLCRTRATLSLVRRWALRRGLALGIEAATPATLSALAARDPILLDPSDLVSPGRAARDLVIPGREPYPSRDLPPESEMGRLIGGRPGLTEIAKRWVQQLRAIRRTTGRADAPSWLLELEAVGFGVDDDERMMSALLDAAEERGSRISASASWDRIVTVGFAHPERAMSPWDPALVSALTGLPPSPPAPACGASLNAIAVPDTTAEARLATQLALEDPEGTLVLVAKPVTARRLRDVLARNGLSCSYRDRERLSCHALADVVRRALPWFSGGRDPILQAAEIEGVFGSALLASAARSRYDRRAVSAILRRSQILSAPLSTWRKGIALLGADTSLGAALQRARADLGERLEILRAAVESRPIDEVLSESAPLGRRFDPEDFEAAVAELLGERRAAELLPRASSMGALHRFLSGIHIHAGDPAAEDLLAALREREGEEATEANLDNAIRSSSESDLLGDGVEVMLAEDWDGRPCRSLIVLDVHDRGLSEQPPPDPLLSAEQIEALGALSPPSLARERLQQILRASAAAGRATAIVSARDGLGRRVLPPLSLDLSYEPREIPSYGIGLPGLPEARAAAVLAPSLRPAGGLVAHGDKVIDHLAVQASAEWFREGLGAPSCGGELPPEVAPYLGISPATPHTSLQDERRYPVDALITPLARCPYRAFVEVILGVGEPHEGQWPLEHADLPRAFEAAFERASEAKSASKGRPEEARLAAILAEETDRAVEEVLLQTGAMSEARRASIDGHKQRWNAYWPSLFSAKGPKLPSIERIAEHHPLVTQAVEAFRAQVPSGKAVPDTNVRAWVIWAARAGARALAAMPPDLLRRSGDIKALPAEVSSELAAFCQDPSLPNVRGVLDDLSRRLELRRLPVERSVRGVVFGAKSPREEPLDLGEAVLKLGAREIALSGRIARIDLSVTRDGERLATIVAHHPPEDRDNWQFRHDQLTLRDPALLVQAMLVERAGRTDLLPEPFRKVRAAAVTIEPLLPSAPEPKPGAFKPLLDTWLPVDRALLVWAAKKLGRLIDDARVGLWPLAPRTDACPMLAPGGRSRCPAAPACRRRGELR